MADSTIEWTDKTWNPLAGCAYASEGCRGCYAAREAHGRLSGHPLYEGLTIRPADAPPNLPRFTGEVRLAPDRLGQPLAWRKPARVFVNSMSDLFEASVPDEFIAEVFATMALAQHHQFQVLTKRPQRMATLVNDDAFYRAVVDAVEARLPDLKPRRLAQPFLGRQRAWLPLFTWPLRNVWLGTSIELDKYTFRADHVRRADAAVRFLSLEPLLGPLPSLDLTGIDWVIVGGESGPSARPMHATWLRDLRDQCTAAAVPFLFKQWGEWAPPSIAGIGRTHHGTHHLLDDGQLVPGDERLFSRHMMRPVTVARVGKKAAGRQLDGRTWDEQPADRAPAPVS